MHIVTSANGEIVGNVYDWQDLKDTWNNISGINTSNIPDQFYKDVIAKKARIFYKCRKTSFFERLFTYCQEYEETFTFEYIVSYPLDE